MNFYKISIKTKLLLGFMFIIFLSVFIVFIGIFELKKQVAVTTNIVEHTYMVNNAVKNIKAEIMTTHVLKLLLLVHEDVDFVAKEFEEIEQSYAKIDKNFEIIFTHYLGPKEDINRAFEAYQIMLVTQRNLFTMMQNNNFKEAKKIVKRDGHRLFEIAHKEINSLNVFSEDQVKKLFQKTLKEEEKSIQFLTAAIFLLIAVSSFITLRIIQSILNPLKSLLDILESIDNGNLITVEKLKKHMLNNNPDEVGKLFNAIYKLIHRLLIPYTSIIKSNRSLIEMTDEVRRLLNTFHTYIIASKTDLDGRIIYVSEAFSKISGYSEKELLGQAQSIVRHPDMPTSTFRDLWQTIQSGKTWSGEIKNRKKDGSFYWVNARISPDVDRNGNIIGYNAIREDITLQKAFEELTNTLENRVNKEIEKNSKKTQYMLQQSRLAQMGEMISMIAHQWRQPLSSISAISGTLTLDIMMDNYKEKYFQEKLESISELSQHLSKTIDDFRGFFKEDKAKEICEIKDIIEGTISIIGQSLINKNINLSVNYTDNPKIETHPNEVKQVLLNLIKNAEDILLEESVAEAKIEIEAYLKDDTICISVADNAGGVPEEIMDKIFNPYFSTKKAKDGTGLGLYMSKTIIEEHCKGKLLVENRDNGAAFTVVLAV